MTKFQKIHFFCEDCGHEFFMELDSESVPDDIHCEKCESEFVNHDYDRSIFKTIGMPELEHCNPSNCGSCSMGCELAHDKLPDSGKSKQEDEEN